MIAAVDLDKASFDRKIRDFATALSGSEAGVFFYAGHGLQVAGRNYLVPIDAELSTPEALEFEMVQLDVVHRIMERLTNTNIIFLDACRNNPLARNLARAMGTRSAEIGRGLAPVESGVGTLISFSTQPGNVALDGTGRNSPFASSLAKRIATSTDDLSALLIDVRNDVRKATENKQIPWEHSALTGRFYFNTAALATTPPQVTPSPARLSEAAEAWDRVKDSTNVAILETFIARYRGTFYAELASSRIAELKRQQVAVAHPVPPPSTSSTALQTNPKPSNSAWVKVSDNERIQSRFGGKAEKKTGRVCLTHHERLDGNSGMVLVSAAVRRIDGQDKQHFIVTVPPGMQMQPGMRISVYPKYQWELVQKNEKVDENKLKVIKVAYKLCNPDGCTAEVEATGEFLNDLRTMGGLFVITINAGGQPVGFPVPLVGFAEAYAGLPVDNQEYDNARKALIEQIKQRHKQTQKK